MIQPDSTLEGTIDGLGIRQMQIYAQELQEQFQQQGRVSEELALSQAIVVDTLQRVFLPGPCEVCAPGGGLG